VTRLVQELLVEIRRATFLTLFLYFFACPMKIPGGMTRRSWSFPVNQAQQQASHGTQSFNHKMFFWILFIAALLIAVKTNPSMQDFENIHGMPRRQENGLFNFVTSLFTASRQEFQRKDFITFCIIESDTRQYLGCFGRFFLLKELVMGGSNIIEDEAEALVQQASIAKKNRDFAQAANYHRSAAFKFQSASPRTDFVNHQAAKNFENAAGCAKTANLTDLHYSMLVEAAQSFSQVPRMENRAARCYEQIASLSDGTDRLDYYRKALELHQSIQDESKIVACQRLIASTMALLKQYPAAGQLYYELVNSASADSLANDFEGLAINSLLCKAAELDEVATFTYYQDLKIQFPRLSSRLDFARLMQSWQQHDVPAFEAASNDLKRRSQEHWHEAIFDLILSHISSPSIT
jgi:hypothetical protein